MPKIEPVEEHETRNCCKDLAASPKDRFNEVYWIVFLIGVIAMMPWDMMVTVNGYWAYKFRNTSLDEILVIPMNASKPGLTKRQIEFESYISIASSIPSAITVILHAFVGNRFTIHWRALVSLIGMIATFSGIIILAYLDSDDWATSFLISNLTLAVVINIFRALFRATNSANMGKFPVKYMGSLANGICMGGLIPVLVNIFFLSLDVDIQMAGFACFLFSFLTAIVVLLLFLRMERLQFYQYYSKLAQEPEGSLIRKQLHREVLMLILHRSWVFILTAVFQQFTTSLIYPAATSLIAPIQPNGSEWHEKYFSQITCFLTFNVFNSLGTALAGLIQWPNGTSSKSSIALLLCSAGRTALIPLIMLSNLAPRDRDLMVLVKSDWGFTALMAMFAMSDGYIGNMVLMFGPKVSHPDHQEIIAGILIATLTSSMTIGSIFSNVIVKML